MLARLYISRNCSAAAGNESFGPSYIMLEMASLVSWMHLFVLCSFRLMAVVAYGNVCCAGFGLPARSRCKVVLFWASAANRLGVLS